MAEVLYRKWRPKRLVEVVGQDAVTQTLRNAVSLGRIAHAYLFTGPRGTGKTSTARIMAKAANCREPQDGEPDDACDICLSINEGRSLDLIEIDAASNRGIDDIRDLRDKVGYTPHEGRYKVYIIDEVHMLTEPAFNALLKTLEEPPAHAIFILATTEIHKVPLTIISRCQRYDFRRISLDTIQTQLDTLAQREGHTAEPEALELLARSSSGSLRDAENLLEQALVSYGSPLRAEQVRDLLELGGDERALDLARHALKKETKEGLAVINEVSAQGVDLQQFHRMVMDHLRGTLLIKSSVESSLGFNDEVKVELRKLTEGLSLDHLVHVLKTFSAVDVKRDLVSTLPLEMALVESSITPKAPVVQAAPAPAAPAPAPARQSTAPPRAPARQQPRAPVPSGPPAGNREIPPAARDPSTYRQPAASTPPRQADPQWDQVVRSLRHAKGKKYNLGSLLRDCRERRVDDDTLTLMFAHRAHMERMQEEFDDPASRKLVREAVQSALGSEYEIHVSLADGGGNGPKQNVAQKSHLVRAARMMGARVIAEKEENPNDE
ncbi:MAG: DNA polymerase III subunit gamma/tau [Dehalococcoidia bacterium]|nr:DNA polymerase III subunit gamma/tau [Dehalococcoidia bacterium]